MKHKKLLITFPLTLFFIGCANDSESDLNPPINTAITYVGTVKSIIDNNCIMCHASTPTNGAPMPLTSYQDVKDAVLTRGLLDRISRAQGSSGMMPKSGTRLPQSTIDQITKWKDDGFLD